MNTPARIRLMELLADRALEGLSITDEAELARLLAEHPDVDPLALDLAAAVLAATMLPEATETPLPEELRRSIEEQARSVPPFNGQLPAIPTRREPPSQRSKSRPRRVLLPWVGWAAAACLLVAVGALWVSNRPLTVEDKFARLLAAEGAWVRAEGGAPDPKVAPSITGEIYWSGSRQEGYMKLRGLPVNDPNRKQYQLWIFDAKRDQRYPVDGGVFNVASSEEVLIPIQARLPIDKATLFVITGEPPGGVVVSDRKEIVLVAALK